MKKIIIISVAVLLLIAIGVGIFFIVGRHGDNAVSDSGGMGSAEEEVEETLADKLWKVSSVKAYKKLVADIENEHAMTEDEMYASVIGVEYLGKNCDTTFTFTKDGAVEQCAFYMDLFGLFAEVEETEENAEGEEFEEEIESITAKELKTECEKVIDKFCKSFGSSIPDNIYVYNRDGSFALISENGAYDSVIAGNGFVRFAFRDRDGYYWDMVVDCVEGMCTAQLIRFGDKDLYADVVANIDLSVVADNYEDPALTDSTDN